MTDIEQQFGVYFSNGILEGTWHLIEGEQTSTITVLISVPGSEYVTEYDYTLTYEIHPAPDGTRNFFYQHKGQST